MHTKKKKSVCFYNKSRTRPNLRPHAESLSADFSYFLFRYDDLQLWPDHFEYPDQFLSRNRILRHVLEDLMPGIKIGEDLTGAQRCIQANNWVFIYLQGPRACAALTCTEITNREKSEDRQSELVRVPRSLWDHIDKCRSPYR